MAVIGIAQERIGSREKRETKTERYYKRVYIVKSNDHRDDGTVIETAFGIPRIGQSYVTERSYDRGSYCYSRRSIQLTPTIWEVTCEWSNDEQKIQPPDGEAGIDIPNYDWSTTMIREVVTGQSTFDLYNGEQSQNPDEFILLDTTGIVNSAYEPYNPPAERDRAIPTLTVKRREPVFYHRYMLAYVNSVNKFRYWGWAARTIKLASIQASIVYDQKDKTLISYWDVTYQFQFNIYTWDLFLLDIGTYYFEGGVGTTPLVKKPGLIKGVPSVVLLTSDGDRSTTISRYNRYRVTQELDFNPLMIPMVG